MRRCPIRPAAPTPSAQSQPFLPHAAAQGLPPPPQPRRILVATRRGPAAIADATHRLRWHVVTRRPPSSRAVWEGGYWTHPGAILSRPPSPKRRSRLHWQGVALPPVPRPPAARRRADPPPARGTRRSVGPDQHRHGQPRHRQQHQMPPVMGIDHQRDHQMRAQRHRHCRAQAVRRPRRSGRRDHPGHGQGDDQQRRQQPRIRQLPHEQVMGVAGPGHLPEGSRTQAQGMRRGQPDRLCDVGKTMGIIVLKAQPLAQIAVFRKGLHQPGRPRNRRQKPRRQQTRQPSGDPCRAAGRGPRARQPQQQRKRDHQQPDPGRARKRRHHQRQQRDQSQPPARPESQRAARIKDRGDGEQQERSQHVRVSEKSLDAGLRGIPKDRRGVGQAETQRPDGKGREHRTHHIGAQKAADQRRARPEDSRKAEDRGQNQLLDQRIAQGESRRAARCAQTGGHRHRIAHRIGDHPRHQRPRRAEPRQRRRQRRQRHGRIDRRGFDPHIGQRRRDRHGQQPDMVPRGRD